MYFVIYPQSSNLRWHNPYAGNEKIQNGRLNTVQQSVNLYTYALTLDKDKICRSFDMFTDLKNTIRFHEYLFKMRHCFKMGNEKIQHNHNNSAQIFANFNMPTIVLYENCNIFALRQDKDKICRSFDRFTDLNNTIPSIFL